jgi:acetyl esterase/lipase
MRPSLGEARGDDRPLAKPALPVYEVRSLRDQVYYDGPDADPVRHKLDLFLPKDKENFPVIFFIHGGAWVMGDKSFFGRYTDVGKCLARHGIGAVLPNYRLSPRVKHPEHIKDVARAFAWTARHIKDYGGDIQHIFVGGHSAGGHLSSLLVTDPSYLKQEGIDQSIIKGVIAVSGVYRFPDVGIEFKDGKPGEKTISVQGLRILPNMQFTIPTEKMDPKKVNALLPSDLLLSPLDLVFGDDPKTRKDAFPLAHVRAGLPPFLLIYASRDLPGLALMAEEFAAALRQEKCSVRTLQVPERNHFGIVFKAKTADDPVASAMIGFVERYAR